MALRAAATSRGLGAFAALLVAIVVVGATAEVRAQGAFSGLNQGDNLGLGFNNPLSGESNPLREVAAVPCSLDFTAEQEIGDRQTYMNLCEGFSTTISSENTFETVIVGDDEILSVAVINSQMLSVTGIETGATNVQFFTRRGDLVKIVTVNVVNRPDFSLDPLVARDQGDQLGALSSEPTLEVQSPLLANLSGLLGGLKGLQGDFESKIEVTEEEKEEINVVIRAGGQKISYSCEDRCSRVNGNSGRSLSK